MTKLRLDRRRFVLTSASAGALLPLTPMACNPVAAPLEPVGQPGEFGNPFTLEAPGPHAAVAAINQPTIYAGLVNETEVRLWCEVRDIGLDQDHPQQLNDFVDQIVLKDDFGNDIAAAAYTYDTQARLIRTVTLAAPVQSIYAYQHNALTGWWRAQYAIDTLNVDPVGDTRRAFTANKPKPGADAAEEVPLLGQLPTGEFAVEVGNRGGGKLHPMEANHYIQSILVYDEFDQLRQNFNLGPNFVEPVVTFPPLGSNRIRVITFCNQHNFWEGVYQIA
jgi:desulfoferrodoxin (superoxide reductase-like protein)